MSASVLPAESTVLVTGANGFVASHLIEKLLQGGYKVRGTTRSAEKLAPLHQKWDEEFGVGQFETVVVPDLTDEPVLLQAMEGVSAVAHVATDLSLGNPAEEVIATVVNMTLGVLATAKKSPSIRRVVLTSSTAAGLIVVPDVERAPVDETTWNEESKVNARKDNPDLFDVYCATKTEGEQAAWRWVEEEKPHFEFNSVLPNTIIGPSVHSSQNKQFILSMFEGDKGMAEMFPPQHYVSVEDVALVHFGALTLPSVAGDRLWTVAGPYCWDDVLDQFRKLHPSRTIIPNFQSGKDLSKIDNSKATAILKELGRPRWMSLEASVESLVGRE